MLSKEDLNIFLEENVNEKTFNLFAALFNLQDPEIYQKVMNLLYYRKINFFDLLNLPFIDDQGVQSLLDDKEKYLLPIYNSGTLTGSDVYSYLTVGTFLTVFFNEYNLYMNDKFLDIKLNTTYNVNSYSILYKDNLYKSDNDFETDFQKKVVEPILDEYSIANISEIFPTFSPDSTLPVKYKTFLNKIINTVFLTLKSNFTNSDITSIFVLTNSHSSVVLDGYSFFTDILNLKKFNEASDTHFARDLHNLSISNKLTYSQIEINALWDELFTTTFDFELSTTKSLGYIRYRMAYLITLEEKNSLSTSALMYSEFLRIYEVIEQYIQLHKKLDNLIISNLNVRII